MFVDGKYSNTSVLEIIDATIDDTLSACAKEDVPASGHYIIDTNCTTGTVVGYITVKGQFSPDTTINDKHTFGIIYGTLIKNAVLDKDRILHDVKFFNPDIIGSSSEDGGFVDPVSSVPSDPPTGLCQVCHEPGTIARYASDGVMPTDGHAPSNCTDCHYHDTGFKGLGHSEAFVNWNSTYDGWNSNCAVCHNPTGAALTIAKIHNDNCEACHTSRSGSTSNVRKNFEVDATYGVDARIEGFSTTTSTCTDCHNLGLVNPTNTEVKTNYATIHHVSENGYGESGECT